MATWFHFTHDYNHYWPSRAWTEFKAGMKVYVKDGVAEAAEAAGAGKPMKDKPKESDPGYVPTKTTEESSPMRFVGNPIKRNAPLEPPESDPVIAAPDTGGSVIGEALSPASGGVQGKKAATMADHLDLPPTGTAGDGTSGGVKAVDTKTLASDKVTGKIEGKDA